MRRSESPTVSLMAAADLERGQVGPAVVEDHHLVDHRELEVRRRVVDRHARRLDLHDDEQRDDARDPDDRVDRRSVRTQRQDAGERALPGEQAERRRRPGRAPARASVENVGLAARAHPLERAAGVERAEHERDAAEPPDVGEPDEVERERERRAARRGAGRGTPIASAVTRHDPRREAEHRRRHRAVDRRLRSRRTTSYASCRSGGPVRPDQSDFVRLIDADARSRQDDQRDAWARTEPALIVRAPMSERRRR